ncbi:hypothetical protein A4S05_01870 [Nostoc sp. KVJ20]|nr:hypothetical protein A4S05_01870 [Nostoc sp. KVJ20]
MGKYLYMTSTHRRQHRQTRRRPQHLLIRYFQISLQLLPSFDAPKFPKLSAVEWNFSTTFPPAITGFDEFQPVVTEDPIGDNSDRI